MDAPRRRHSRAKLALSLPEGGNPARTQRIPGGLGSGFPPSGKLRVCDFFEFASTPTLKINDLVAPKRPKNQKSHKLSGQAWRGNDGGPKVPPFQTTPPSSLVLNRRASHAFSPPVKRFDYQEFNFEVKSHSL
jgi:hypothetical protein